VTTWLLAPPDRARLWAEQEELGSYEVLSSFSRIADVRPGDRVVEIRSAKRQRGAPLEVVLELSQIPVTIEIARLRP
jgi:hypothetical protein